MPATHKHNVMWATRQHFTLREWSWQIQIIDSMALVDGSVRARGS
jgi:hypothetical protein